MGENDVGDEARRRLIGEFAENLARLNESLARLTASTLRMQLLLIEEMQGMMAELGAAIEAAEGRRQDGAGAAEEATEGRMANG